MGPAQGYSSGRKKGGGLQPKAARLDQEAPAHYLVAGSKKRAALDNKKLTAAHPIRDLRGGSEPASRSAQCLQNLTSEET